MNSSRPFAADSPNKGTPDRRADAAGAQLEHQPHGWCVVYDRIEPIRFLWHCVDERLALLVKPQPAERLMAVRPPMFDELPTGA